MNEWKSVHATENHNQENIKDLKKYYTGKKKKKNQNSNLEIICQSLWNKAKTVMYTETMKVDYFTVTRVEV